jgi:HlyD family secretion protein
VEQAREELELARKEAQRVAGLYESGSIAQSELDKARARLNQARAVFNSREAALEKARGPARPAELRSARAKLEQARAELALADRSLEDTHIVAPSSGTVVTTAREAGEFVTAGSPIVEIADLSEVYVDVYVSEPTLSRFTLGAAARIKPDGTAETLRGHVAFVSPRAEFTPTNVQTDEQRAKLVYRVKVRAENPAGTLKIGMPVEVEILPKGDADRGSSDG